MSQLRNEIEEKQGAIAELRDENQKLNLAFEQLQRDYGKLKEDEQDKSKKLNVSAQKGLIRALNMTLYDPVVLHSISQWILSWLMMYHRFRRIP